MDRLWFHVDLDAFYASVEQRDTPAYRGKPVIVGSMPGTRGVVSTCSYEARKFGVRSAMPINAAYKLCPHGIYLRPRMKHYSETSTIIMECLQNFTPEFRQISIDEAFLNMTGMERIWGSAMEAGQKVQSAVYQASGLSLSLGAATNRLVAKMASDVHKPNGITIVPPGNEAEFVQKLDIHALWGIGKKSRKVLNNLNIRSVHEILALSLRSLQGLFGQAGGSYMYNIVRGIDTGIFGREAKSHSLSNEYTFPQDCSDRSLIEDTLFDLVYQLVFRLHSAQKRSSVIVLKLRLADFSTSTVRRSVGHNILTVEDCHALALELFRQKWNGTAIRLIGIGFAHVEGIAEYHQPDFFDDVNEKRLRTENAVLSLQNKYKGLKLTKARNIGRNKPLGTSQNPKKQ